MTPTREELEAVGTTVGEEMGLSEDGAVIALAKDAGGHGSEARGGGGGKGGEKLHGVETHTIVNGQRIGKVVMVPAKDKTSAMSKAREAGHNVTAAWEVPGGGKRAVAGEDSGDAFAAYIREKGGPRTDNEGRILKPAGAAQSARDAAALARGREASGKVVRLIPDAPALSTPRKVNGTLRSGMDENVVTVSREEMLGNNRKNIERYIASGRDVSVHGLGAQTGSITDFAPGSTLVYRYKGMRSVGTMKVPSMTKPWDGTIPKA